MGTSKKDLAHGDFRMNMMCADLEWAIKDNVQSMGRGNFLRPEVASAFRALLESVKELDKVTTKYMKLDKENGVPFF